MKISLFLFVCAHFLWACYYGWQAIYDWDEYPELLKVVTAFICSLSFIFDLTMLCSLI